MRREEVWKERNIFGEMSRSRKGRLWQIYGMEDSLGKTPKKMDIIRLLQLGNFLPMDMDYLIWRGMFGSGVRIGICPTIIGIARCRTHRGLMKVMIQMSPANGSECNAADLFFALTFIAGHFGPLKE